MTLSVEHDVSRLEEMILESLEKDAPLPFDEIMQVFRALRDKEDPGKLDECAEMLEENLLAGAGNEDQVLELLRTRAELASDGKRFAEQCAAKLKEFYEEDRARRVLLDNSGFSDGLAAVECLRRFEVLRHLESGVICYEKTWGCGKVRDIDEFARQVVVDFERKQNHRMSFSYAAESLALISDEHIMAMKFQKKDELDRLVASEPGDVVRMALRDFGPMSAPAIQEMMLDGIVPEKNWKRFWDGARKALKADPLVKMPSKRNDPIMLMEKEKEFDDAWFAGLEAERDFRTILDSIAELKKAGQLPEKGSERADLVRERLEFVVSGAIRDFSLRAEAMGMAGNLGLIREGSIIDTQLSELLSTRAFAAAAGELSSRLLRNLVDLLKKRDSEKLHAMLLDILGVCPFSVLGDVVDILIKDGLKDRLIEGMEQAVKSGDTSPSLICWIARNMDFAIENGLGTPTSIVNDALAVLSTRGVGGEDLKSRNQIRNLFEDQDWVKKSFTPLEELTRCEIVGRMRDCPAWDHVDRGGVLVRIVRMFPEAEKALADKKVEKKEKPRLTSVRSYRQRQKQLEHLVNEEIPANSKEIGVARSYGDLRENAEYKAAKEKQAILMRRQEDLESMLNQVQHSDFNDVAGDRVGCGTRVGIKRPDGSIEVYHILGEWDNDESKGVISSQSRFAQAVEGKSKGDQVRVPGENGEEECIVDSVNRLPPEILLWAGMDT